MLCTWAQARRAKPQVTAEALLALQKHCDVCPRPCAAQKENGVVTYKFKLATKREEIYGKATIHTS
jgi:hypothetical protein